MRLPLEQYDPAEHDWQSDRLRLPSAGEKVPAGQPSGAELPAGQYEPRGQMLPVTPSVGASTDAPSVQ
jgi:hypothetical protein